MIKATIATHVAALTSVAVSWQHWPQVLAVLAANHAALTTAGLIPRSHVLGTNLTSLPDHARRRGEVALTFDDGPDPDVTPRVLDLLEQAGARATFFCIGIRGRRHAALVREIARRGHDVQNHTMHHPHLFAAMGPRRMRAEILEAQNILADITGIEPRFFRAVAGLRNPFLDAILQQHALTLATWTRRAFDTRLNDPVRARARLTSKLAAADILLLHDGHAARASSGQPMVLEVLPAVLASLREKSLCSVTLTQATRLPEG